jgi:hypothetical protein
MSRASDEVVGRATVQQEHDPLHRHGASPLMETSVGNMSAVVEEAE